MEQSEEQYLENLQHIPNSESNLNQQQDIHMKQEEDELENDMTLDTYCDQAENLSAYLPQDIVVLVFKYLDCKSLAKVAMTNSYWYELYTSKDIQKWFKVECFDIFDKKGLYSATKKYLTSFQDWKNMFIYRPRVRWDGVYFAKVQYWHDGITEFGDYHPIHEVIYYIFLWFTKEGKVYHAATSLEPQIFLEKLKRRKVEVDSGTYYIRNKTINIEIPKNHSVYSHKYELKGSMNTPSDSFVLKEKTMINPITQDFQRLNLHHSKATFEFHNKEVKLEFE